MPFAEQQPGHGDRNDASECLRVRWHVAVQPDVQQCLRIAKNGSHERDGNRRGQDASGRNQPMGYVLFLGTCVGRHGWLDDRNNDVHELIREPRQSLSYGICRGNRIAKNNV